VPPPDLPYKRDLALVHHRGFGFHAEACAPGILELLGPVRTRDGLVVEIGCGSGLLTKELVATGHRVIATDASPAMLELARDYAGDVEAIRQLVLPDDPIPDADAIVSVGHPINYLPDEAAIDRALVAMAHALRPGGLLAIDICDLEWGEARRVPSRIQVAEGDDDDEQTPYPSFVPNIGVVGDDWAIITRFSTPSPNKFVREMTTFVPNKDGSWRRDDERHDNVLIDTSLVPALLARHGVEATVGSSFGSELLPAGLRTIIGRRSN
jgi:SAM-dependent methyltransferase